MFPEEIKIILEKYKEDNVQELQIINKNVSEITEQLKLICAQLSQKMSELMSGVDISTEEDELLQNSKILRKYINSINNINIPLAENNDEFNQLHVEFTRKVCPYIVNDDLCPFCNVKLISHNIFYQEKNNGVICDKSIKWHKCPNCKKLFALDHDIIDFNSTNTNVEFNTKYYNKVLFHDTIVIFNINKCSSHNHEIEDLTCELPIIKSKGEVEYTSVPIIYCKTCKRYIMLKSVYDGLNGVPACIIINETRNKNDYTENDFQHGDNGGSKLYQYGYNVNCNDNLTVEQRHTILSMQLLSNNLTKGEICSTLDTNINNGLKRKSSKRDWSNAVSKWKADKEFVQKINLERENEKININKLILKFTEVKS